MKENINALDEISKGATMGIDALNDILGKVEDKKFKEVLEKQKAEYTNIEEKIEKLYPKYNDDDEPHKTNVMNKMMTWYGIEMRTMNDTSNSKLAELLIKGTNMGIIEGKRILNQKEIANDVRDIVDEFVSYQEKCVEVLKKYL